MNHRAFGLFPCDDPPAPQEPPQHHTPLSPPRSRKVHNNRPSISSGVLRANMRNSAPVQSSLLRPQTPKMRTKSADETLQGLGSSNPANLAVTTDKIGSMVSNALPPVDQYPPTTSEAWPKNITSATFTAAITEFEAHMSASQSEVASAFLARGVKGKRALKKGSSSSHKTTTMPSLEGSPRIPGHPYAGNLQAAGGAESYFVMRRDSVDTDRRSLISSFLDAYCRSEVDDAETDLRWPEDASMILSDDTASLEYASRRGSRDRPDSDSTIVATNDTPTKRPKPASLVTIPPPDWEGASKATDHPSTPRTTPAVRNTRPLPPLPPAQRQIRPLPRPPVPPPYTSQVDPVPALATSSSSSASSSTTSSPSTSDSTSFTSISAHSSTSSAKLDLDKLPGEPNISKRPLLAPILTITACSSQPSSPLTPDIPIPPSPMTARRHQASKLSKMLGEDITPDLLGGYRQPTSWQPLPKSAPLKVTQYIGRNFDDRVVPASNIRSAPAPTPTFRDAEMQNSTLRSRAIRPQAIYMHDDTSEESHHIGDSAACSAEEGSLSELSLGGESSDVHLGISVNFPIEEEQEDQFPLSSADSLKAGSEADSILEELDDFEEAHIGWALQNVVTYPKASHVKRATRAWVLERNGQQCEEQNFTKVLKLLRQL